MAESPEIVVRVRSDSTALVQSLQDAGIKVQQYGGTVKEASGLGQEGMKMISLSAQQAALSMGLPGPVARKLGGEVDSLVAGFGRFAVGIGVATLSIATAIAVYNKFIQYKKEQREELERSVGSMRGEVMALYQTQGVSESVRRATYDLTIAKRDLLKVELKQLIIAENEEIAKQEKLLAQGGGAWDKFLINLRSQFAGWDPAEVLKQRDGEVKYYLDKLAATLKLSKAQVAELKAEYDRVSGTEPSLESNIYTDEAQLKDETELLKAQYDLRKSMGTGSTQEMIDAELQIFDYGENQKLLRLLKSGAATEQILNQMATSRTQRQAKEISLYRNAEVERWNTAQTVTSELSGLMDRYYAISGEKGKAFFYLSRGLAAASAFCHYQSAAATATDKSASQNQTGESWMANYYRMMSIAVPAAILAESFTGTGGNSPGSSGGGSSSSSSTYGMPTESQREYVINININGQPTDVPKLTEKIVREIGRNNGSVGGFTVGVSGSA